MATPTGPRVIKRGPVRNARGARKLVWGKTCFLMLILQSRKNKKCTVMLLSSENELAPEASG